MSDLNAYLQRQLEWASLTREQRDARIAAAAVREEQRQLREQAVQSLAGEFGSDPSEWDV